MRSLALLLCTTVAWAAVESELVTEGIKDFREAEFEKCIEVLGRALQESLTREEKVEALRTLAFCHSALDHTEPARQAFIQLLRVDEKVELDKSIAPKMRALFEEARAAVATGTAPQLQEPALPSLHPNVQPERPAQGQKVSVTVEYPGGTAQSMQLFYRARGQARYETLSAPLGAEGRSTLEVPGRAVQAPALELYLTALDARGAAVARAGGFAEPFTIEVAAPPKPPVYKRGWFWGVIVGAAAAGAAVGLGVGLTRNSQLQIIAPSQ